ncbi:transglycosylase SLT domain-containing protein [Ramlibacter sp. MAHUQ-53]|uniref:lytic transglycosylase domain-containing protein n=1 Tax=unclassified Ramlibacter TaxID=2617605 RepID=UPI003639B337
MKFRLILTLIAATLAGAAQAQGRPDPRGDEVVLEMAQAFRQGQRPRLAQLLPQLRGHLLEPWGAYWELRARLDTATPQEVQDFLARWAGTYQEDRLRNDWLLLLGQRRDWTNFAPEHARFRMNDDTQVKCYALTVQHLREGPTPALVDEARRLWFSQREAEDACTTLARALVDGPRHARLQPLDVWRKARLGAEFNRPRMVRAALEIVAPQAVNLVDEALANPVKYLDSRATANSRIRKELVVLALARLAATEPETAAATLDTKWSPSLTPEERNWLWGAIGRQSAFKLSPNALSFYGRVTRDEDLTDEMLAWKARATLRAASTPPWKALRETIEAMGPALQRDPAWTYWRARALLAAGSEADRAEGRRVMEGLASPRGFYEQLALEELGQRITVPPRPAPLTAEEREAARTNPGLQRALHAIAIGLRADGVREWNYTTNLHRPGGMGDRELLAAAQWACEREVWDRCINTSERTRAEFDVDQRFPMPMREAVLRRSREIALDPSYVYGLIRQESRFVTDARSHVGASGLMQVMPATARWTARRIGLNGFNPDQLSDRDTNIAIGTAYLKLVLDDFGGSMPMAAAAYNAGPSRPRAWRNGPVLEGAAWAENVPFNETRDYVKKVLANATLYAAVISGQPQSLRARLGTVGPRDPNQPEPNRELP